MCCTGILLACMDRVARVAALWKCCVGRYGLGGYGPVHTTICVAVAVWCEVWVDDTVDVVLDTVSIDHALEVGVVGKIVAFADDGIITTGHCNCC